MHLTFIKETIGLTDWIVPVIRETGERLELVRAASVKSEIDSTSLLTITVCIGPKKAEWKC